MLEVNGPKKKVISNSYTTVWSVLVSKNGVEIVEPFIVVEKMML